MESVTPPVAFVDLVTHIRTVKPANAACAASGSESRTCRPTVLGPQKSCRLTNPGTSVAFVPPSSRHPLATPWLTMDRPRFDHAPLASKAEAVMGALASGHKISTETSETSMLKLTMSVFSCDLTAWLQHIRSDGAGHALGPCIELEVKPELLTPTEATAAVVVLCFPFKPAAAVVVFGAYAGIASFWVDAWIDR